MEGCLKLPPSPNDLDPNRLRRFGDGLVPFGGLRLEGGRMPLVMTHLGMEQVSFDQCNIPSGPVIGVRSRRSIPRIIPNWIE